MTLEDIAPLLDKSITAAAALIPVPKDGRDGVDGKSVTLDEVMPHIEKVIAEAVKAIPIPKDGRDGRDGVDGKSVTLEDVKPHIDHTISEAVKAIPAPKDGRDGRDGVDGLGFEDLSFEHRDDGSFAVFSRGELRKEARLPGVVYRDVWGDGVNYKAGDAVTWAGSMWIARQDTAAKPGASDTERTWRLCVKAGSPGKTGPAGPVGPQGQRGEKGDSRW